MSKNAPYAVPVKAGQTLYLCRCGRTATPPLCDGAHGNSGIEPLAHTAAEDGSVYVCGCGKTGSVPFCDGSHKG